MPSLRIPLQRRYAILPLRNCEKSIGLRLLFGIAVAWPTVRRWAEARDAAREWVARTVASNRDIEAILNGREQLQPPPKRLLYVLKSPPAAAEAQQGQGGLARLEVIGSDGSWK